MKQFSNKLLYTIGIVFLSSGFGLQAQSLDQAKKLYNEGNYEEAKPAFERLVKQSPSNSSYNQWYGVCCFETGDFEAAEKHLLVANNRKVQESYHYLGELYYLTYRFEESSEMFEEYIKILTGKKQDVEAFELRKEQADKAARLLERVERVQVVDSVVVDRDDFLSTYYLSEENGVLSTYKNFFRTNEDVQSVVYINQRQDKIFYAQPTDENRYCLFTQSKLLEEWGDEKQLPMNINSAEDDNYPFVMPDGVTIYYASKGNGSLGGYDLFVTRYNMNSDSYLAPEQMGMPFNSPFNDYMLVIDENKNLGWFVSDRFQSEDKVCIYLFIPNTERARVESEDIEEKRAQATLASIATTWAEGADYQSLIALAHEEIPFGEEEIHKDFEFVVNDNIIYYVLEEIQSPEAKSYYERVVNLKNQIDELSERLADMRTEYTRGNKAKKEQLTAAILQAEQQLDDLLIQPHEWEKKARNAEINYLSNH
ncbi:tetratricopeptide repeat protein [Parabacteroides sp. OttesenSCG-928-G07]|nr:tetratricopeptide repeat protein [Parabacteroides sp. OttesenSCG-928-G21]MDL2278112.1 tetratricopeptide repeat protein [Parabacteroides sp. OttesenSCG-928-G07]